MTSVFLGCFRGRQSPYFRYALVLLVTALTGCLTGGGSSGAVVIKGEKVLVLPYQVAGNLLITDDESDTLYSCDGSDVKIDIRQEEPDTVEFQVSGDMLAVHEQFDTTLSGVIVA